MVLEIRSNAEFCSTIRVLKVPFTAILGYEKYIGYTNDNPDDVLEKGFRWLIHTAKHIPFYISEKEYNEVVKYFEGEG